MAYSRLANYKSLLSSNKKQNIDMKVVLTLQNSIYYFSCYYKGSTNTVAILETTQENKIKSSTILQSEKNTGNTLVHFIPVIIL